MAAVSKGRNHLRDASFSSYLDTADTDFVRSLAASMHESSPIFTPSRLSSSSSPSSSMSKRRTRGPLGELGVFGAESYFGDQMDRHDRTPSFRSIEERVPQHKSKLRTPSIRSESSWSSRSSRNTDQIKPKKSLGGPWFLAGLQCKGSCYDVKPPVYTMKQSSTTSTNQRKGFWEDQVVQINSKKQPFHQPQLSTVLAKQPERMAPSFAFPETQEEDSRKSIEVFGLNPKTQKEDQEEEDGSEMSFLVEKKLSMLSWDAIPTQAQHKRQSSGSCRYDDMESDASSDLFDIAVFPAEMSPVTAPYEPSEASIEWSVVTASAAEFSAVSDDVDEVKQIVAKKKTTSFKPKELQSGGILGCRNDKAVKVVNPANATARKASFPPIPPKNSSFASKAANTCSSSSARAPRAIYMY